MKYVVKLSCFVLVLLLFGTKTFSQQNTTNDSPCGDMPSIVFKPDKTDLTPEVKSLLKSVASKLKENAETHLIVSGSFNGTKHGQALCLARLDVIKTYVNENLGITKNRIKVAIQSSNGDINTIDLKCFLNE